MAALGAAALTVNSAHAASLPGEIRREPREILIGEPLKQVLIPVAAFGVTSRGQEVGVLVSAGRPGKITVVDPSNGKSLSVFDMPAPSDAGEQDTATAWAVAIDSSRDHGLVATTDGRIFLIDLLKMTCLPVGGVPDPDVFFERAIPDGHGGFLLTSYGEGALYRCVPAPANRTGNAVPASWARYGPFGSGNTYSIGLAMHGGNVYVGTGTADPAVYSIALASGAVTRIDLPVPRQEHGGRRTFVYDVAVSGDFLFARVDPENRVYIRNLRTGHWTASIDDVAPGLATPPSGAWGPRLFYAGLDQRLYEYDPVARTRPVARSLEVSALRGSGWMRSADASPVLVTTTATGTLLRWSRAHNQAAQISATVQPGSRPIRSLGVGPEGTIVAGAFGTAYSVATFQPQALDSGFAPGSGKFGALPSRGQIEAFASHGYDLIAGSYPGAELQRLASYNPLARTPGMAAPPPQELGDLLFGDGTDLARSATRDAAPAGLSATGGEGQLTEVALAEGLAQDRPVSLLSHHGRIVAATTPDYGERDGAISVIGGDFTAQRAYRAVVPGQSPLCLAAGPSASIVVAGTGPATGMGAAMVEAEGRVIALDVTTGRVIRTVVPVSGARNVSALAVDSEDGSLWGITRNAVFQLDLASWKVSRSRVYGDDGDRELYVSGRRLYDEGQKLVGCAGGIVFEIDKRTLVRQNIGRGSHLVRTAAGELYYSRGSQLFGLVR